MPQSITMPWRCRSRTFTCGNRTLIAGILNVTPDSFSDGGQFLEPGAAAQRALQMQAEGADLIDIGGESSRPGACAVPLEEELRRVIPLLNAIRAEVSIPVSIDTTKAEVARQALEKGADIINDITALRGDPDMARVVAQYDAGLVMMHMQGSPRTMQENPSYQDVVQEVEAFLSERIEFAVSAGISSENICIDQGIGFGKTVEDNLALIAAGWRLRRLGVPIFLGVSRKSFIGKISGVQVSERLEGSLAAAVAGVLQGADIIRAHDVSATRRACDIADAMKPFIAGGKVI